MKKKIISAALTLALVLAVCITGAFAAHGGFGRGSGTCLSSGQNFIDEDGDGLCDNWAGGGGWCGNGQCFIDEDGDGVCDNWTSRPMDGTGLGAVRGHHGCHN